MPRTYVRLFWREIRHSLNRFLAILAIVALGTGFLTGLIATTPDMRLTADRYYDNSHMMDLRIVSTGGLTDKDIEALKNTDGVEEVMPAFQKDAYARYGDSERKTARIHSLGDKDGSQQNRVTVYEGRLPEKAGECVLIANHLLPDGLAVGDTITVSGLVTAQDLIAQLRDRPTLGERVLIPANMLRHGEGVFLDDYTVEQVEQALARPLTVSETDGFALCDAIFMQDGA